MLIGVRAEQFDDVAIAQTFILQPLIFLGGVFYSAALLPEPFQTTHPLQPGLLHDRPRALRLPRLLRDSIALSLLFLTVATAALFAANLRLFSSGYKLRA